MSKGRKRGRPRKPRPAIDPPPPTPTEDGLKPPAKVTTREVMRAARTTAALDRQLKTARAHVRELEQRRRNAARALRDLAADVAGDNTITVHGVDRGSLP